MITIDNNNYELWLLRYAENELTQEERHSVEQWLAAHPEAAEELALYSDAPRLQTDPSVVYTAKVKLEHRTMPLWPIILRWSAAAAVLVALIVPAFRMGRTDSVITPPPPIVAETDSIIDTLLEEIIITEPVRKTESPKSYDKEVAATTTHPNSIESIPSIDSILPTIPTAPIPTNTLIAFDDTPNQIETVTTDGLIAFDRSSDWGDILLAANEAYRESLNERPLGRMVSRALPDSRQLEENVVAPLRERIDNMKNKRK